MNQQDPCWVDPLDKTVDPATLPNTVTAYLSVSGMGCAACALRVRNGLLGLEGVLLADVFLAAQRAAVVYDPRQLIPEALLRGVANGGHDGRHRYHAEIVAVRATRNALTLVGEQRYWDPAQTVETSPAPGGDCCGACGEAAR